MTAAVTVWTAAPVRAADERLVEFNFDADLADPHSFTPVNGEHSAGSLSHNYTGDNGADVATEGGFFFGIPSPHLFVVTGHDSLGEARSRGGYLSLTVAPEPGYALNLTSLAFDMSVCFSHAVADYQSLDPLAVAGAFVYGSPDGFTSLVGAASVLDETRDQHFAPPAARTVGLDGEAGEAYQGLTGPVTLRLYLVSTHWWDPIAFDNIVVRGTAVPIQSAATVPEPGTPALLGPAALIALTAGARRRRGRSARPR